MARADGELVLADTSAWARIRRPELSWLADAAEEGRVAVCDQVAMELLFSARDALDFRATEAALLACPWLSIEPRDWGEARRVFRTLAERGPLHHRQVKIPDLLIAAVAGRYGIPVVHYDPDFDVIASVTSQPTRWAAPRGSI